MFYTYLWLREDGTPYYVGKGKGDRAFVSFGHNVPCPRDLSRILLQEWPSEEDAFEAEKFLIEFYGRKDLGTGCLRNLTNGGENPPSRKGKKMPPEAIRRTVEGRRSRGFWHTDETRKKIGNSNRGKYVGMVRPIEVCERISKSLLGNTRSLGYKHSEEAKAKIRSYRHTEEAKQRIREAMLRYRQEQRA